MIELDKDEMVVSFPDVHPSAELRLDFQRTLRIPDDDKLYPLPAGLGRFPLRHVDDFEARVPAPWIAHGGVMLPMYQSEALWIDFSGDYPMAVKIAAGKINAVTGKAWSDALQKKPQDYVVATLQPWLDGYCVEKGVIRQFVAMPLGSGYSAEEQITGEAKYGGLQIIVYPMKREVYRQTFESRKVVEFAGVPFYSAPSRGLAGAALRGMGLAPGGRMRQEIYDDPFDFSDWDTDHAARCFVHLANSMTWRAIVGEAPPTVPFTAAEYQRHRVHWFDYYAEGSSALPGAGVLNKLLSVVQMGKKKNDAPLPDNDSIEVGKVVELRKGLKDGQVREGRF